MITLLRFALLLIIATLLDALGIAVWIGVQSWLECRRGRSQG